MSQRDRQDPRIREREARDRLGELIQLADDETEVSGQRAERVWAQVREQLPRQASAPRAPRAQRSAWPWAAAAALLVVAVGARFLLPLPSQMTVAQVRAVVGAAQIRTDGGDWIALEPGQAVTSRNELSSGPDSRIALRLPSGHSVRLDVDSAVRIDSASRVELIRGAVYVDSHGAATSDVVVACLAGEVREIGTQFEVRQRDGATSIRVREGAVQLERPGGHERIEQGAVIEVDRAGRLVRGDCAPFGPEWDWLDGITPSIAIDGRPLREFLDWAARESGLELAFDNPEATAAADRIRLSGSIDGMSPDEALQAVLPTCQMTHSVESGILRVHSEASIDR